jgi:hypothetical protein
VQGQLVEVDAAITHSRLRIAAAVAKATPKNDAAAVAAGVASARVA